MKHFRISVLALTTMAIFSSCSDDDATVMPVNEEEVITTVTAILTPVGGGNAVTLTSRDLDGDGPNDPVNTISGTITAGTTYNGTVRFLNELANPAEDISLEIEQEGDEHQIFFVQTGNLGTFTYTDTDVNGKPVGLEFKYSTAASPATGLLQIVLRHEPNKDGNGVSGGSITNAGGSTDAEVKFSISVVTP
jgi:hypothetical protein